MVSPALSLPLQVTDCLQSGNCLTVECFYVHIHARIEPGNVFRLVLKIAKYTIDVEYGLVEMVDESSSLVLVN